MIYRLRDKMLNVSIEFEKSVGNVNVKVINGNDRDDVFKLTIEESEWVSMLKSMGYITNG
jgi:hypothetical protein